MTERLETITRYLATLLLMIPVGAILTACAAGQSASSKLDPNSGSYVRARLLHEPHPEPWNRTAVVTGDADPWIAFDKAEHVTFGFLFTLGGQYVFVNKAGLTEHQALPLSIGVAASAGLAKELLDRRRSTGFFSKRDLVADAVGIVLATTVILL